MDGPDTTTAGWLPDPSGRHRLRWWDGTAWTAYAGDGVDVQWDPQPVETPVETAPGMPGIVTGFVAFAAGVVASLGVSWAVGSSSRERAADIALSSLALWVPLVLACVLVARRRGSGSLRRDYGLRFKWSDVLIGLAGAVAGRLLSATIVLPIPVPSRSLNDIDEARFGDSIHGTATWVALILVTCVGAPFVEELFFRGLLQARLVGRYGPVVGISTTSLLFGAAHLMAWNGVWTFAYAWAIAGAGLVLGTLFHLTRRLGPGIAAHAWFNAQAMLALALLTS